jgi:integrase
MGSTKTGRSRVIELDAGTVAVLRQQWKRQAEDRLLIGPAYDGNRLFCHATGEAYHPDRFSREFDRKLTRFNKDHASDPLPRIRLHDLRHTWASLAQMSDVAVFASFRTVRDEVPPGHMNVSGDVTVGPSRDDVLVGAGIHQS